MGHGLLSLTPVEYISIVCMCLAMARMEHAHVPQSGKRGKWEQLQLP